MSCRDEFHAMLYVDGELPVHDVPAFEEHLAACARCHQRVAALRAESALIGDVLHETEPAAAPAPVTGPPGLAWAALALAVAAAGVHGGLNALAQLDSQLGWLSPFSEHQQISALFGLFFLLTQEDIAMLFTPIAALATALLLGTTFAFLTRRRLAAVVGLLCLLVATAPASATEVRTPMRGQGDIVVIPAGETIDDTVIAGGRQVVVEGTITGDLIALAEMVRVSGEVRGSLVSLAKSVSVDGVVKGDVYSASQTIDVRGSVGRNLHAAAESLDVASGARVAGDAWLAGKYGRLGGTIGRDLRAAGESFSVTGVIDRAVSFSGRQLDLAQTARVRGEINAYVPGAGSVTRASSAQLASEPQIHKSDSSGKRGGARRSNGWLTPGFYFWQAMRIAAALALGLLLYWLMPALFEWPSRPERHLLRHGGVGFLALVATPVAAVLLSITVIGLPIGALALGAWIVALYLSGILVALMLGQLLLRSPQRNAASFTLALLTGLALLRIAVNLPYLGVLVWLLVIVVGLGLLIAQLIQLARRLRAPAVV